MARVVEETAKQLFKLVADDAKKHEKLTDEMMSALHCVFPTTLLHAVDLIDRKFITKFVTPSKREIYQVKGSSGVPYFCFASSDYCTCPSYLYTVLLKREALMCKHLLAMHLAISMNNFAVREISDEDYVAYIAYETESPMKKER
eukprot:Seg2351.7 transcript_id=Seg2351.7/GoldUCD/mRNA.D3Y31 product="Zinc finger SWIM domain-containing protein 7" protein_id=Seg2351.7/GoldUCD/D3Y31